MLDEQFFGNSTYTSFITKNFISIHAVQGEKAGDAIYKKFAVTATPTILLLDSKGREIDRVFGYYPPPEGIHEHLKNSLKGIDTFVSLKNAYENNPEDILAAFKLAKKYEETREPEKFRKAIKIYSKILKNPAAKKAGKISYGEYSNVDFCEYTLYSIGYSKRRLDENFFKECLELAEKYPSGIFADEALGRIVRYFADNKKTEDALLFFNKMLKQNPDNLNVLNNFVDYCIRSKTNIDKGLEIAEKLNNFYQNPGYYNIRNYARLLELKKDNKKLNRIYGPEYINDIAGYYRSSLNGFTGFWLSKEENVDGILEEIRQAAETNITNSMKLYARICLKNGKTAEALKYYGPAFMKEHWGNPDVMNSYSYLWAMNEKNLKSSLTAIERAIELDPKAPRFYDTLSTVYWKMKEYEKAIKAEEKALEILPGYEWYLNQIKAIKKDMAEDKGSK